MEDKLVEEAEFESLALILSESAHVIDLILSDFLCQNPFSRPSLKNFLDSLKSLCR